MAIAISIYINYIAVHSPYVREYFDATPNFYRRSVICFACRLLLDANEDCSRRSRSRTKASFNFGRIGRSGCCN